MNKRHVDFRRIISFGVFAIAWFGIVTFSKKVFSHDTETEINDTEMSGMQTPEIAETHEHEENNMQTEATDPMENHENETVPTMENHNENTHEDSQLNDDDIDDFLKHFEENLEREENLQPQAAVQDNGTE